MGERPPPSYFLARRAFLAVLAVVYLAAFGSLGMQVCGLVGERGIEPAARLLDAVARSTGVERYWLLPTLCWLGAGNAALLTLSGAGALLSLALLGGFAPAPVLALLWVLYLSLEKVGGDFLRFQWDALLLEAEFLAVFLAPPGIRPGLSDEARPSRVIVALFHWLLFRLMFSSGAVKLLSGDLAWRDLTALSVHYETQPLPTWVGWYVHQLPLAFHAASAVFLFVIELAVPWLVFRRGRARSIACAILLLFQVLIAVTGNYGFFNLLTVGLCLLLLEDSRWPARWRRRLPEANRAEEAGRRPHGRRGWVVAPVAVVIVFASALEMSRLFGLDSFWPRPALRFAQALSPFEIVNGYGLFAVMTVTRAEIVVEGSRDGASWSAYEFRWKPGDVDRRPAFVGLHMPRLDWQMWFAALGTAEDSPWFLSFLSRLLEGSPDVTALLATNPFPDEPPRYVRATLYRYRFTATRSGEAWWRREPIGSYVPAISLRER